MKARPIIKRSNKRSNKFYGLKPYPDHFLVLDGKVQVNDRVALIGGSGMWQLASSFIARNIINGMVEGQHNWICSRLR